MIDQTGMKADTETPEADTDILHEDAIRALLTRSYKPVEPRREFETRLLNNLKERQRNTRVIHRKSRKHTLFFSAASSIAAAATVLFIVWALPRPTADAFAPSPVGRPGISLPVPAIAVSADPIGNSSVIPAAYTPGYATDYTVAGAFAGAALADSARLLQNVAVKKGGAWEAAGAPRSVSLAPGTRFRAEDGMGHIEFSDGTLLSLSPDSSLEVTDAGLSVNKGFILAAVPPSATDRFRLHFPERDVAVEPGTELAVMVEDPSLFAEGGAPAPLVMVVDRPDSSGGLALARGGNGVGPLFASQMYRLDRYVTPDLPGRALCDAEYQDLNNLFKTETIRETLPMAAFAGGFSGAHDLSSTTTVLSPAGFTKKADTWVADSYRGEPTVKVQYLSDAYFGLANDRRDLARALALGGSVILDAGDKVFYEIHK